MPIKVIIPQGQTEITVNGLHQWDYGQTIEIHSADLPAMVEVHFACAGMTEAVVRSCNAVSGVATAVIPDHCLEQTTPIVAWVYEVSSSSGFTSKTITLPIIPRTRPQACATVPTTISDKYTECIAAVNDLIEDLAEGNVTVKNATVSDNATKASQDADGNEIKDTYAKKDDLTSGEIVVAKASQDADGNEIKTIYAKKDDITSGEIAVAKATNAESAGVLSFSTSYWYGTLLKPGYYLIRAIGVSGYDYLDDVYNFGIVYWDGEHETMGNRCGSLIDIISTLPHEIGRIRIADYNKDGDDVTENFDIVALKIADA